MLGTGAVTILKEPQGALLLRLGAFPGGTDSILERIPSGMPGVYAWYRAFDYPDDPVSLHERLLHDLEAPKFIERSGPIKPYYDVTIRSRSWFSDGKREQLRTALHEPAFRKGLLETLSQAVLLQAPLYLGRAADLKVRIANHLQEGSVLRERLGQAGVNLERSLLMLLPNAGADSANEPAEPEATQEIIESFLEEEGLTGETSDEGREQLYEEIYSRLFNPQFTIRLG